MVCQARTFSDLGSVRAQKPPLPCSSSHTHTYTPAQAPPLPIRGLYKPSSLKQLSQSSADSSPEPGILGGRESPLLPSPVDLQMEEGLSKQKEPPHRSPIQPWPQREEHRQGQEESAAGAGGSVHGVRRVLEPRRGTKNNGDPCMRKLRNNRA